MKTDKPKSKGRTPIVIDWDKVDKYLQAGLNGAEISLLIGVKKLAINKRCLEVNKMTFAVYSSQKRVVSTPAGRPEAEINWNEVVNYLKAGLYGTEIAPLIGVCADTLYRHCEEDMQMKWSEYSANNRAAGDGLIKLKIFSIAMGNEAKGIKPDTKLLEHLDKTRLGATVKKEIDMNITGMPKVNWVDDTDEPENEASDE